MNPISLLCEIIGQARNVAAHAYRADERYGALLDSGLIQSDGVVQSVLCENCDALHDAEIGFEGGAYGHYCPNIGFVPVERADLVAMRPNLAGLVEKLQDALECEPGSTSQLGPQTWRIGLVNTPGGRAVVYFHRCLSNSDDLDELETALRSEIRRDYTLVVTAVGRLQYRSARTRSLTEMVLLESGKARLSKLASVGEVVGAPLKKTGGRPNLHRERLHLLLAERVDQGSAEEGRNAEAEAVRAVYLARYPNGSAPRLPTVKAYVSEFRSG